MRVIAIRNNPRSRQQVPRDLVPAHENEDSLFAAQEFRKGFQWRKEMWIAPIGFVQARGVDETHDWNGASQIKKAVS